MSRTPTDIIEVEFGEDTRYSPPPGADRWTAFRRTDIMGHDERLGRRKPEHHLRGRAADVGRHGRLGYRAGRSFRFPSSREALDSARDRLRARRQCGGVCHRVAHPGERDRSGLREALMVVAYVNGRRHAQDDVYRVPAASAIDPTVIAAQERRTCCKAYCLTRDSGRGSGGIIKQDHGEGSGEEFESLAVLDRRIAECRARIAWFEQAAEGNDLPGAAWAGLTGGPGRPAARTVAAAPSPDLDAGTTIMRAGFSGVIPHGQSTWRWVGTLNSIELDSSWTQPASFALWAPGDVMSRVVAVVLLRTSLSRHAGRPREPRGVRAAGRIHVWQHARLGHINACLVYRTIQLAERYSGDPRRAEIDA